MTSVLTIFFGYVSSVKGNKSKNKQIGLHQTKNLLHGKGNHQQKRQPTKWEKIFANHIDNERLIFKIYEEFIQLNNQKITQFRK